MRFKNYLALGMLGLYFLSEKSNAQSRNLNQGLYAFMDFNEGKGSLLTDYSGNNYHARIVGVSSSNWVLGNTGNKESLTNRAIDLAYANKYISFSKLKHKHDRFTLSLWVNPSCLKASDQEQIIVNSHNLYGPILKMQDNGTLFLGVNGVKESMLRSVETISSNTWNHVVITWNNTTGNLNLYTNGKIAGSRKIGKKFEIFLDGSFVIGKEENQDIAGFDGLVDELLIYNRDLNQAEINQITRGDLPSKASISLSAEDEKLVKAYPQRTAPIAVRQLENIGQTDFPANPLKKKGYVLTVNDEFEGPVLNQKLWIPYYLRQRVSDEASMADYEFRDGAIVLKVTEDKEAYNSNGLRISSIQTFEKPDLHKPGKRKDIPNRAYFLQQYGYYEIRAKTQAGPGNCSTFWLLGRQNDSTETGEIDVIEQAGNLGVNSVAWNLYDWHDERLRPRITNMGYQNRLRFNRDLTTTFNIYGCEWTPTEIRMYLNNELINTIPKSPQYPMGVFLSLYVGNDWFGKLDPEASYPKEFIIDYFRAYRKR